MISGSVNSSLDAIICLFIEDDRGAHHPIDFVVDTGFTGEMGLPSAIISATGLSWTGTTGLLLGNGTAISVDEYAATVIWDSQPRLIRVRAVETTPLIGMRLLAGYELRIRVVSGGFVWVDHIP